MYDSKCFELAEHFIDDLQALPEDESRVRRLAQAIQDAVEDFLEFEENKAVLRKARERVEQRCEEHAFMFSRSDCLYDNCPYPIFCRDHCIKRHDGVIKAARSMRG
jgi:hypothetical protein